MWMLRTERSNVEKWQKIVEKQTHAEAKLRSWRFKTIAEAFIWMATKEKKKNLNILKVKMISEVVSDQKTYRRRTSRRLKKNIWNICFCFWREHAARVQSVLTGCTVFSSTSSHWSNFLHVHIKTKKCLPLVVKAAPSTFLLAHIFKWLQPLLLGCCYCVTRFLLITVLCLSDKISLLAPREIRYRERGMIIEWNKNPFFSSLVPVARSPDLKCNSSVG